MRPWVLVAAAVALLAGDACMGAALAAPSIRECLEQAGPSFSGKFVKETFGPSSLARYDHGLVDARGVVWRLTQPVRGAGVARYAVAFDGTANCWIGGRIVGTGQSWRTAPSAIAVGTAHATRETALYLLNIRKTLNGIWIGREAFDLKLGKILFADVQDTCIVADHHGDLIVDNVFFWNCARVVKWASQRAGSALVIRNSLIRINNAPNVRTRGRLFNGDVLASDPRVYFENNVVVTAAALDARSLSTLEGNCSGNTLIWLGSGDYPGNLPGCFTVVRGNKAWQAARAAWMRQHRSQLAELGEDADPGGSACALPQMPAAVAPNKTVGQGSPASCTEGALRSALSGGGTIRFSCGASPVTIPITAELAVTSPTVLDGGGTVTLDGQNRTRIIRNNNRLILKEITLTRGRVDVWNGSPNGGGAVNTTYGNRLYVVDSTFTSNRTSAQGFGGAIFQAGAGALTVVRSRFENNVGGGGGAIYSLLAGLHVVDSAFIRNQGSSGWQGGGGIMTDGASAGSGNGGSGGEILVCGSSFEDNQALATGGGAYLYAYGRDTVAVTHSTFTGNRATPNSGGLSMGGGLRLGASPALVSGSEFRHNVASTGGAIATEGRAQTKVQGSTFQCNSSDVQGGRVLSEGNTTLGC